MPLPYGNPYAERVLVSVFNQLGEYDQAAHYGAAAYTRSPNAAVAIQVARSVAAIGNAALARQWLSAAETSDANGRPPGRRRDARLPRARPSGLSGGGGRSATDEQADRPRSRHAGDGGSVDVGAGRGALGTSMVWSVLGASAPRLSIRSTSSWPGWPPFVKLTDSAVTPSDAGIAAPTS